MAKKGWSGPKIIGTILMIAGAYFLIASTGTIPMAVVSLGPISVSGLSEQRASTIFVGIVLFVLGYGSYNGFDKLKKLFK